MHGRLEQQDPGDEGPGVSPVPGPEHGEREQQGGQQHQEDGDAVDPQVPVDAEAGGPGVVVFDQLEAAVVHLHGHEGGDGEAPG